MVFKPTRVVPPLPPNPPSPPSPPLPSPSCFWNNLVIYDNASRVSGMPELCGLRNCVLRLIISSWVLRGDLTDMHSWADYVSPEFCDDMRSQVHHMFPEFCEDVTYRVFVIDGILVELTDYEWGCA
ncbi:hypothetical protein L3X38_017651 [Prunus dulcis]|uniref:Uncharacterized protein n=1 Tax=Prunus dulcis TaxID=3755 RepID=A0AAD4Z9Z6_PRUDU|nr:hypothetical protein L3X38_017651 [Prunus dulcis]